MTKAPKDQGLFLTVFSSVFAVAILIVWALLPVYHIPVEEGDEETVAVEPRVNPNLVKSPEELMENTIVAIKKAEAVLEQVEENKKEEGNSDGAGDKKDTGKEPQGEKEKG